jgi:Ca2+-binding RTX toxin-like protein
MPIEISTGGASVTNTVTLDGAPAVLISGDDVTFDNLSSGVLLATTATEPVIRVTGSDAHIINRLGGRIEAQFGYYDAILGGSGSDVVDNYATIYGWTRLGDGADTFNQYFSSGTSGTAAVDLGAGDDRYNLLVGPGPILFSAVHGGTGVDTLNLASTLSVVYGFHFLEFEHLILGPNVTNLVSFNDLVSVTLTPGGFNNFVTSVNPNVDLLLDANWLSIGAGSEFRTVTGGSANDALTLFSNSASPAPKIASADLGGGADVVFIQAFDLGSPAPVIGSLVSGGAGDDTVEILSRSATVIDLTRYAGFEQLGISTQIADWSATARVANADDYLGITTGGDVELASSSSPLALVTSGYLGRLTLASDTIVGSVSSGNYAPGFWDIETADPLMNMTVINSGTILGGVDLNLGDDLYDGSLGTTGGIIFGYAGNDLLKGGTAEDTIEGGFGNDTIHGGGGLNYLYGDAGDDRIVVIAADTGSVIDGGAGLDTLVVTGAIGALGTLAGLERIELLPSAALTLTGTQLASGFAVLAGTGIITLNLDPGVAFSATGLTLESGASIAFTVNGTGGSDAIKANLTTVNTLNGSGGNDQIRGGNLADAISGGLDNDKLMGLAGADTLTGGAGADQFRYLFASDSGTGGNADQITDFVSGTDRLNFALLDADPVAAGRQALSFIGTQSFHATGAAEVRYGSISGGHLMVLVDLDGNGTSDMEIVLLGAGAQTLTSGDFML